ncbi:tRNA (adenosine(37)-N6)-threonylcarbamoyltransferase complex dimerization subunit type 1 TsaB [Litorimonas sp. WD9-15]|uniref:tRNA (adenosine(37)-N6)-threonylcarbamoyltransferase complex dimerization subunit type 1 TsaB n=1 Tax=Litorimonas sp. WD9-15 TaxID=3418716 RepID=UPI003D085173
MIVLGLDTTGPDCSVSLVDEASVLAHMSKNIGRGHAEVLAGMVEKAFALAGLKPDAIDRIAVCTGPGSFTGLRVALSFAIGFALPRNLPVIGIDALGLTHMKNEPTGSPYTVPYKDIRRQEVMFGTYSGPCPLFAYHPKTGSIEEAKDEAKLLQLDLIEVKSIDTRILAWLAINLNPADYPPEPLYSRGPDAKLPGGASPRKA